MTEPPIAYTGTPSAVITSSNKEADISADGFEIAYFKGDEKLAEAPKDAGDYKLVIKVKDDNSIYAGSYTIDFTIAKKEIEMKPAEIRVYRNSGIPTLELDLSGIAMTDKEAQELKDILEKCKYKVYRSDGTEIALKDALGIVGTYTIKLSNSDEIKKDMSEWSGYANYGIKWEDSGTFTVMRKSSGGGSSALINYTITVTQSDGGKISPDTKKVGYYNSAEFTITPDEGYEIEDVLVNEKSVGAVKTYKFNIVTSNATITAKFKKSKDENEQPAATPTTTPVSTLKPTPSATETPNNNEGWLNPFNDVNESDWFYQAVKFVSERGIMNGITDTEFDPNADITRGMFVTILYRIENEPEAGESAFEDVDPNAYYSKAVAWASDNGIVLGYSDTIYAPDGCITREQMAAIVYRYARFKGYDLNVENQINYLDSGNISDYAKDAVRWSSSKNIMQGNTDNTFAPERNSTRAQAAAVFKKVIEIFK